MINLLIISATALFLFLMPTRSETEDAETDEV